MWKFAQCKTNFFQLSWISVPVCIGYACLVILAMYACLLLAKYVCLYWISMLVYIG